MGVIFPEGPRATYNFQLAAANHMQYDLGDELLFSLVHDLMENLYQLKHSRPDLCWLSVSLSVSMESRDWIPLILHESTPFTYGF
jgi:hypothetical protein